MQIYTICYWLSSGLMVNQIQIASPEMDWCLDSPLNKSCFPKPWKEIFVLSWLIHHTNISMRMVSKKFSVSVRPEKHILSHLVSVFSGFFVFLHRFRLRWGFFCLVLWFWFFYFFEWKTQQELKEGKIHPTDAGKSWTSASLSIYINIL